MVFLSLASGTEAATLYMDPNSAEINRGDTISVSIRLDTDEGECVNTIDGVIEFTENIVPVDTSRGSSILSVWLEEPTIDKANRTITFAGGIPNGYCGRVIGDPRLTNHVLEMVFAAPGLQIGSTESGNVAEIAFAEGTRVLLNDGFGTDAALRLFDARIDISRERGNTVSNEWNDRVLADDTPPEDFTINLERSRNAFSNRYFIVFNTTDKQSGIDYYEVIEEPLDDFNLFGWGAATAPWVRASSPYVLEDQSLNSTIRVRAYDKAGNDYIATLIPDESARGLTPRNKLMIAAVISGLVLLFGVGGAVYYLLARRRERDEVEYEYVEEEVEVEDDEDDKDYEYDEEIEEHEDDTR